MRPLVPKLRFVLLLVATTSPIACGASGSSGDATGTESSSGAVGSQGESTADEGGGSHSTGSTGTAGAGSDTDDSAGTGGDDPNLYVEPDEIVGGPCGDAPIAVSPPCSGAAEQEYCRLSDPSDVIMAVCPAIGLDQCEVVDDCEAGWHACTATDYVARGGRDVAPDFSSNTDRAWLAACVQDLGDSRFRNEPCSFCGDTRFEPVVQWWCDGQVVYEGGMAGSTLGVLAAPECMRVGDNLPANGAYWSATFTTAGPNFVMCCLDAL